MSGTGGLDRVIGASGESAGSQAQYGIFLQLLTQIAEALTGGTNPFSVSAWTTAGNLVISTAFPTLKAGTISIRQTTPAAINVTLPASGGPWIIADGAGVAATDNITVLPPSGKTILGTTSYVISTNWGVQTFILDGNNYILG